jgi:hypothetical protein
MIHTASQRLRHEARESGQHHRVPYEAPNSGVSPRFLKGISPIHAAPIASPKIKDNLLAIAGLFYTAALGLPA